MFKWNFFYFNLCPLPLFLSLLFSSSLQVLIHMDKIHLRFPSAEKSQLSAHAGVWDYSSLDVGLWTWDTQIQNYEWKSVFIFQIV